MRVFEVFAGPVRIGCSALEHGDAPMGVAAGLFLPEEAYAAVQSAVLASQHGSQLDLALRVVTPDGRELARDGNVQIVDYSPELGADAIEVQVIGIAPELYGEWFRAQVAAFQDTLRRPP
ncbi:hypothetical protein [uncultured Piscinibacter sp.]|uniref:hypothetical protein n=1 Tax=uncultured Piscinibacter sp. TaxID=1131835 RepID=UPI002603DF20|nr:hypothetical protein [uncultured Piscinibacter sp.]